MWSPRIPLTGLPRRRGDCRRPILCEARRRVRRGTGSPRAPLTVPPRRMSARRCSAGHSPRRCRGPGTGARARHRVWSLPAQPTHPPRQASPNGRAWPKASRRRQARRHARRHPRNVPASAPHFPERSPTRTPTRRRRAKQSGAHRWGNALTWVPHRRACVRRTTRRQRVRRSGVRRRWSLLAWVLRPLGKPSRGRRACVERVIGRRVRCSGVRRRGNALAWVPRPLGWTNGRLRPWEAVTISMFRVRQRWGRAPSGMNGV